MRKFNIIFAFLLTILILPTAAIAATISVDLSSQTMHVSSSEGDYDWPISSARAGYVTPNGTYGVQRLETMHYSHKYHNSPMPHSIFFRGGYAIHGTYETGALGAPASHGCIRISPDHAATLFNIVRSEGARIAITGSPSSNTRYARAGGHHRGHIQVASRRSTLPALGYAQQDDNFAPSFDDWMHNPNGASHHHHHHHYEAPAYDGESDSNF